MDFLKKFKTVSEYEAAEMPVPHVAFVTDENCCYFMPYNSDTTQSSLNNEI